MLLHISGACSFCVAESDFTEQRYHRLPVHSTDGHAGQFQFGAATYKAAVNILAHVVSISLR